MASDTGGPSSSRVRHVHPVRRSLKLPNASGRSCATPLLPGHPSGLCVSLARLWNRSVFSVLVQVANLYAPVRGVGLPSIGSFRERWSLRKASRLQMVTLSQPATHSFRRGYANTRQYVASTEAILVAELKSFMWLMFGRDPHRGPSTSCPACPVFTSINQSNTRGGSGAQEPRATMSYPSSNLLQKPSNAE